MGDRRIFLITPRDVSYKKGLDVTFKKLKVLLHYLCNSPLPPLISVPDKFAPTLPERGWVVPIMHELNPWWTILVAIVPAILGRF
jgi:hypothetical protein